MKITWLGQAGLLFEKNGTKIMIDPYLSSSVEKYEPKNYRRVPVDERFLSVTPDVLIFTHDHLDHYDPETAPVILANAQKPITVLAPASAWQKARANGHGHNYVQFNRRTQWTARDFRFSAVKAEHSDPYAIGVLIEDLAEHKVYYVTGDTLYNEEIFGDLPHDLEAVFLPINGVGNNMNATDAARFAARCGAVHAVPIHFGMFDELTPDAFENGHKIVLEIYQEREI